MTKLAVHKDALEYLDNSTSIKKIEAIIYDAFGREIKKIKRKDFKENSGSVFTNGYDANIAAVYTEADIFFSKKWAAKVGLRASNNDLLNETVISPRISFAYKMAKNSQFSFAYGDFTQTPSAEYIKYSNNTN